MADQTYVTSILFRIQMAADRIDNVFRFPSCAMFEQKYD